MRLMRLIKYEKKLDGRNCGSTKWCTARKEANFCMKMATLIEKISKVRMELNCTGCYSDRN